MIQCNTAVLHINIVLHAFTSPSVVLSANLRQVVDEFANYQHASWVFDWQVEGWVYGPVQLKEKHQHPNIRPYRTLDQSVSALATGNRFTLQNNPALML